MMGISFESYHAGICYMCHGENMLYYPMEGDDRSRIKNH